MDILGENHRRFPESNGSWSFSLQKGPFEGYIAHPQANPVGVGRMGIYHFSNYQSLSIAILVGKNCLPLMAGSMLVLWNGISYGNFSSKKWGWVRNVRIEMRREPQILVILNINHRILGIPDFCAAPSRVVWLPKMNEIIQAMWAFVCPWCCTLVPHVKEPSPQGQQWWMMLAENLSIQWANFGILNS